MKQECENAILQYAPFTRQHNAALFGEHREYIRLVIELHRNHYQQLKAAGQTVWSDLPAEEITWLTENQPY